MYPVNSSRSRLYKTELCKSYDLNRSCVYGLRCQFAHGPEELRDIDRPYKYKTKPCSTFHNVGLCNYGRRCNFIHNESSPFYLKPVQFVNFDYFTLCSGNNSLTHNYWMPETRIAVNTSNSSSDTTTGERINNRNRATEPHPSCIPDRRFFPSSWGICNF